MKNNELQELKPVYIHEKSNSANDEISLIDLAMVLVNRKKLVVLVFTAFIVLGIAAALLITKKYTYSTSIEIGSQIINGNINSFESTQTLLAKLQHSYIPQVLYTKRHTEPENKDKYKIVASVPKGSNIIVLEVKGTQKQAELITQLLKNVTQKAIDDHNRIYNSVKSNITARLNMTDNELKQTNNTETKISSLQELIELYASQLANLRNTRAIQPPMQSIEPTSVSRMLIVIIATFSGFFVAVFTAFLAEFLSKVRDKRNEVVSR